MTISPRSGSEPAAVPPEPQLPQPHAPAAAGAQLRPDELDCGQGQETGYLFEVQTSGDGRAWSSITPQDPPHYAREAVTAAELADRVLAQYVADEGSSEPHARATVWAGDAAEARDAPLAIAEAHYTAIPSLTV